MMRLIVLAAPDSWYLRDLRRAAGEHHEVEVAGFGQLRAQLPSGGVQLGQQQLDPRQDVLLVRTMPPASLEQVVFRMDVLGQFEAAGGVVVNPARALEAAVDKYLALAKIRQAGLNTPRTVVCQDVEAAMQAFQQLGGEVVVKPLFGGEGRGITRLSDEALALRAFKMLVQLDAVIYLQEYLPHHGFDIRLLLVGDHVLAIRRVNRDDWRTNVSRGAIAEPLDPDGRLVDLARRAAAAVGAPLAGVDVLPTRSGQYHVLEVNAVPGWRAVAGALQTDVAALVIDHVERRFRGETPFP